jgi:hypothetical protein
MKFKDVTKIVEYNSTFSFGELRDKFVRFLNTYDSMGLNINGLAIDLGEQNAADEDDDFTSVSEASVQDENLDIPTIWVLKEDGLMPVFIPIFTDGTNVDFDRAVLEHGMDIIELKTPFTELVREVKFNVGGIRFGMKGTYRDLQKFVIETFEFQESRMQILLRAKSMFWDLKGKESFLVDIPAHKNHVVMDISGNLV